MGEHAKERAENGAAGWGIGDGNLFERARPRKSTTRLAPARRLWRGGGHVGVVGAAKLGSDLEATNRAVGVSGSAHTKAALARGRDAVVEGDRRVVDYTGPRPLEQVPRPSSPNRPRFSKRALWRARNVPAHSLSTPPGLPPEDIKVEPRLRLGSRERCSRRHPSRTCSSPPRSP